MGVAVVIVKQSPKKICLSFSFGSQRENVWAPLMYIACDIQINLLERALRATSAATAFPDYTKRFQINTKTPLHK